MLSLGPGIEAEIPQKAIPLFHRIRNNHPDVSRMAYYLEYLCFHMPEHMLVAALEWLVKNKVTDYKFIELVKQDCASSGLELVRYLTMRLEKEKKMRRLHFKDVRR